MPLAVGIEFVKKSPEFTSDSNLGPVEEGIMEHSPAILTATTPLGDVAVAPLTQIGEDGKKYVRRADVDAEIADILKADPSTWEPAQLKSETLIYLTRWLWRRNDQENVGRFIKCLGSRIATIAGDFTSNLNRPFADDFSVEIACDLNEVIFAKVPTRQSEFLEIAFRQAVKRRAINRRAKMWNQRKAEIAESRLRTVETEDNETGIIAGSPDTADGPEELAAQAEIAGYSPEWIQQGLSAITDERHREAVVLYYLEGWPITDKDPTAPSLENHFSMSPRQIHTWIKTAIGEMRAALGEKL